MRTFHVPLPEHLHEALRAGAGERRRPATQILRQALEDWLAARRRERVAAEIRAYTEAMAGTAVDLDADLEAAGVERLLAGETAP
jgi:predicted transcriptional regulator